MNERCLIETDDTQTARLSGPLTFQSVPALHREMEQRLAGVGPIAALDLSAITSVDSAGLALLLEWQSRQRQRGRELTMSHAPGSLLRLAELCEAVELLNLSGRSGES
jgi:phospholipid transport system transporter-binding protein